jgi:hypothetical protein
MRPIEVRRPGQMQQEVSTGGRKMKKKLKPVPPKNKGLKKLPTKIRNKMGYMKKGGKVK